MSRALPEAERRPLDAYYTPDALAMALVGLLPIGRDDVAWEPHAGGGAFARALNDRAGCVVASDINPEAPGLYCASGGGWGGRDFLRGLPATMPEPDWIVGNPPFRGFEAHVETALPIAPNVAFLLRLAVMESAGRVDLWKRWPLRHVWVLAERPSFTDGGTDSAAYGFFWFDRRWVGHAGITPGWSWKVPR